MASRSEIARLRLELSRRPALSAVLPLLVSVTVPQPAFLSASLLEPVFCRLSSSPAASAVRAYAIHFCEGAL